MTVAKQGLGFIGRYPLIVVLVPLVIGMQIATGSMLTSPNLQAIALDGAVIMMVAVPGTLLVISGYLDLSVGSTQALGAVVAASMMIDHQSTAAVAIVCAALAGTVVGTINAVLCIRFSLSPFIVTLGMLTAVRGLVQLLSPLPLSGFGASFDALGSARVIGIQLPVLIAAIVTIVGAAFMAFTPAGRHVFAIGVNPEAARLSGVAVKRIPFLLFLASGTIAGFTGAVQAARLDAAPGGTLGTNFELTVLTALLLGGVAFTGGKGTIFGAFLGVLFLGFLQNGLTQLNVSVGWQGLVSGVALVAASGISILRAPALAQRIFSGKPPRARSEDETPLVAAAPGRHG